MSAATVETSFFVFASDVRDAGTAALCASLADDLGVGGVTVAATYHASQDFRPRNLASRVAYLPAGAHYFPPDAVLYADSPIKPWCPDGYATPDLMAELRAETARRGMAMTAWTVFGFNERVGRAQPEFTQMNAYGDRYLTDLCPAQPAYAAYACAVAADVTRYRPEWLLAESLHYHPLREGRRFLVLDPWSRLALGLCFCAACERAAARGGVDVGSVRRWARSTADAAFAGLAKPAADSIEPQAVAEVLDGELAAFLSVRAGIVGALAATVGDVAREAGARFCFMDQAGASDRVLGAAAAEDAWRYGVDLARLGSVCDGYQVLGYAPEPADVEAAVDAYRLALPASVTLRTALRPSWPDCTSTINLAEKIAAAVAQGARGIDFYHYGLVSDDALQRVREWGEFRA
jgi:hypothetical protein